MAGDTVTPTMLDFQIAFRGLWWQARTHNLEITWELRDFLIHCAEVRAADRAYIRLQSNSYHEILESGVLHNAI